MAEFLIKMRKKEFNKALKNFNKQNPEKENEKGTESKRGRPKKNKCWGPPDICGKI